VTFTSTQSGGSTQLDIEDQNDDILCKLNAFNPVAWSFDANGSSYTKRQLSPNASGFLLVVSGW
jgi:hypothetical protein